MKQRDAGQVEAYLHEHIPITKAMGMVVTACDTDSVTLTASLEPNLNHRCTAFGGSIATLGILADWSMLYLRFKDYESLPRIVIQRSQTDFITAVENDFSARCCVPMDSDWQKFVKILQRKRHARINLRSEIRVGDNVVAHHFGDFVAIKLV